MGRSIPWSYSPYRPYLFETGEPYICRICPEEHAIVFFWLGSVKETYRIAFRERGDSAFSQEQETLGTFYRISGLKSHTDYEFYVRKGDRTSRVRMARTGTCPGTAVNYLHPEDGAYAFSGQYLCSPSLLRHPEGYLLASMDLFKGGAPQNLTLLYRSDDDGVTWTYLCELMPCFWGKMFIHRGQLYMLSVSTEYGDLLIGRSDDGGRTFEAPTVLLRGSGRQDVPGIHKNPQNLLSYAGRLWGTLEWGSWDAGYHAAMVMSCKEDADLLDAQNWCFTPPVRYDPSWPGVAEGPSSGNIEGTLAIAPDGRLLNIMRYDTSRTKPNYGMVLAYEVDVQHPEQPLRYSHPIPLDGNLSKFSIRKDPVSGEYYSLISRITDPAHIHARNLLSLVKSDDLMHWKLCADILDARDCDPQYIGFQYMDFLIEGEDILFLCRTAVNGANSYHNSNYITFHRIQNFRKLQKS